MNIPEYRPRPIRFLKIIQFGDWQLKYYGLSYAPDGPPEAAIHAAETLAIAHLGELPAEADNYKLGFIGLHTGRGGHFCFIDWWTAVKELYHHTFVSPLEDPTAWKETTQKGLIACTWDLRVLAHERNAWENHILKKPLQPNTDGYLADRLEGLY